MLTAYINGVGTSHFGRQPAVPITRLGATAITEALDDAGLTVPGHEVDAAFVGTVFGAAGVAQRVLQAAGIVGVPIVTIETACASGTTAFAEAVAAVESGRYRRVLCVGVEQMSSQFSGAIHPEASDPEGRSGLAMPALYAMAASRYLADDAVTLQQLAAVSVKNHRNAEQNPRAQYAGDYSIEQVLASKMIADPLTLLQCCPISDGAAAAIVSNESSRDDDVEVLAVASGSGGTWDERSPYVWGFDLVRATATCAYEAAGIGPEDLDVLEVHDAFTIGEITTTEALGLAEIGGGGELVERGVTKRSGRHPVNPSGGLLSRGHPLGATGLAQLAEVTWQLRGRADQRQIERSRIGLVETMGGGAAGIDGNAAVVAVLRGRNSA